MLIAAITAFIDALPVFGSGIILIPWAVYSLLNGDMFFAVWFSVTFIVVAFVRHIIEPKLISSNIGANPLITLCSIYAGFKVFGVAGLLLGPVVYIIFRTCVISVMGGKTIREYFFTEGNQVIDKKEEEGTKGVDDKTEPETG